MLLSFCFKAFIISVISVYTLHCDSDDSSEKHFYDCLVVVASMFTLKKVVITGVSMDILRIVLKIITTSMEVMVLESGIKKRIKFWIFLHLWA